MIKNYEKKVSDYIIVRGSTIEVLEMNVKSRIWGGFVPQGSIFFDKDAYYDRYCQPMIRARYEGVS